MTRGFDNKQRRPGREKPTYRPSGRGTYGCRWRKQERRERAIQRAKAKGQPWQHLLPKKEREDVDAS